VRSFYENTVPKGCYPCNDAGCWRDNRTSWGCVRKDTASASNVSQADRKKTRSRVGLDQWLLDVGRRAKRLCVGAWQMETAAAHRCNVGFAKVAPRSRRIYIRSGRLALILKCRLAAPCQLR
jgi:hypothetical protein